MSDKTDLVQGAYDGFNSTSDVEDVVHLFHPEFRTAVPGTLSVEPDSYTGHEGLRRYMSSFYEVMDEVHFDLVGSEEIGDWMLAHTILRTRASHTGIESKQEVWLAWRFEDGLALEARPFATRAEALAGVSG